MARGKTPLRVDLAGRVCLVTGASAGIGKETVRGLARMGAEVVMACRNPEKGEAARKEILASVPGARVELMLVDLSSQRAIRGFTEELLRRRPALHVLVNNAGVWMQRRVASEEGIELTWATNQLGYFLLTRLLLDSLRAGAPSRIVNVASDLAKGLDVGDVEFKRRPFDGRAAYAQTKQANRMWTWALARRLQGSGVTANAMHPGLVATELFSKGGGVLGAVTSAAVGVIGRSVEQGADTAIWLSVAREVEGVSGEYWMDRRKHPCRYRDVAAQEALWAVCERMTGSC